MVRKLFPDSEKKKKKTQHMVNRAYYKWTAKLFYLYINAMCSYNVRPDSLKHQLVSGIFPLNGMYSNSVLVHWEIWFWICQNNDITLRHFHLKDFNSELPLNKCSKAIYSRFPFNEWKIQIRTNPVHYNNSIIQKKISWKL